MQKLHVIAVAALALTGLGACAPTTKTPAANFAAVETEKQVQRQLVAERAAEAQVSLHDSAFKLWQAAAAMCAPRTRPGHGIVAATLSDIKAASRSRMVSRMGLDTRPRVFLVASGSPAEAAGLRAGDLLVSVDGTPVASGGSGRKKIDALMRKVGLAPVKMTIRREGGETPGERSVTLTPVAVCDYTVHLTNSSKINAYADGNRVLVTKGMMEFVRSATELETVLGHELAHNIMKHRDAKTGNEAIGAVAGLALDVVLLAAGVNTEGAFMKAGAQIGSGVFSQGFESEADYVGLYIMARAGSDYRNAPNFWRRMAAREPSKIVLASSHPTTAERFVSMTRGVAEIDSKVAAGKPLRPEIQERMKDGAKTPPVKQASGELVE